MTMVIGYHYHDHISLFKTSSWTGERDFFAGFEVSFHVLREPHGKEFLLSSKSWVASNQQPVRE